MVLGHLSVPKKIRDEDNLKEGDNFIITHTPSGDIIFHKQKTSTPEEKMLDIIEKVPTMNACVAWKEVEEERRRER